MRVLHLIDDAKGQAGPATFALMAQSIGRLGHIDERVVLLGPRAMQDRAAAGGLTQTQLVSSPLGLWAQLRRSEADIVHCWSVRTFTMAALMARRKPRLLTLARHVPKRTIHWLAKVCQEDKARASVLTTSATLRRTLLSGGVAEPAVHVVRPALDFGAVNHASRTALRKKWGVDDETKIGIMLADPPTLTNAVFGMRALMLATDGSSRQFKLLIHPDQARRLHARRLARAIGRLDWMIDEFDVASPWQVLPGCDYALAVGPHAGNLSLLWAMAANIPIIGDATYAVSEVVEDRHSALLAKPDPSPRQIAHRMMQLADDDQLAWKLKDAARSEAYSFFSRRHYCKSLETVYRQVMAGDAIDPPELEVTGGLRFTGRA